MKKFLKIAWSTVFVLSACNLPGQGVQATQVSVEATQAQTTSGTPFSFQNVSFVIPTGLANGATPAVVPLADESNSAPWGMAPEHIEITLNGYPLPEKIFKPVIHVYPAQEYAAANSWAAGSITRLQAVLANPAGLLTNDTLPTIPFNGAAAQQYAAQAKLISFNGGSGVRMVSQYGQFPGQITRDNSFYHYEGLTSDGKYMVAILFPVVLPLQSTAENPSADGIPYPGDISDTAGLTAYYQGITNLLDAANPETFQPTLSLLDELVQSISIQ
jgi:hypothetical protein